MTFIRREIDIRFQLGQTTAGGQPTPTRQQFGPDGSDVVELKGLRVSANIVKSGTPSGSTANLRIYGMKLDTMNKLATLGMVYNQMKRNVVTVLAGDLGANKSIVFVGSITQAWIDFGGMPDVAFHVEALSQGDENVTTTGPTSVKDSVDVAQQMKSFADKMGLTFENSGVDARLPPSYFYGSLPAQAAACARAAGINYFVDNKVLAIWKQGKSRAGTVPLINVQTGLVGYPSFTAWGIMLKTLFNPDVRFQADIKLETSLTSLTTLNADGIWTVYYIDHQIEAQVPNGGWFTTLGCYNKKFPQMTGAR